MIPAQLPIESVAEGGGVPNCYPAQPIKKSLIKSRMKLLFYFRFRHRPSVGSVCILGHCAAPTPTSPSSLLVANDQHLVERIRNENIQQTLSPFATLFLLGVQIDKLYIRPTERFESFAIFLLLRSTTAISTCSSVCLMRTL